ncbi:MAG: tryptophan-rich sensory protein [Sphaerospermopsis sp. SIO1G2]|nr:tryptophan-rich sensory protein [Sphaerospermopsis sp. SIO1G1]NET69647.1 tryptophan-rich sensory protein [Sphaerospermopsis sp. SIO1G2]
MKESNFSNNQDFLRQCTTLAAIVGGFAVNVISNVAPLNGMSIGEISNSLFQDVLIIPANYAFIIWGLIYLGLFALGVYQFLPSQKADPDLRKTGYLLVVASISQCIWVYLFLSRFFGVSILAMLGILVPLIMMHRRLEIGEQRVSRNKKFYVHYPISIYLGWISVATIVNVACALSFNNWNGFGVSGEIWTVIILITAAVISGFMVINYRDLPYTGVTVWAFLAIAVKHGDNFLITTAALGLGILLIILMFMKGLGNTNSV